MPTYDIAGKIALVTGANRGIGRAITEALLGAGVAKVYAAVRDPSSTEPLIARFGEQITPIRFDLTDEAVIRDAASRASDAHIVVNNAGVLRGASPIADDVLDALAFELDANLYGLVRTARAFAPVLKSNGGGAFVQVNSVVSLKSFPDFSTYCASKAAAYSMTQALRATLAEQGTAVFSVHPGPIATDMADAAGLGEVAEPPSLVGEALLEGLRTGTFHVFPDSVAKQIGGAYASFAENVIEPEMAEG